GWSPSRSPPWADPSHTDHGPALCPAADLRCTLTAGGHGGRPPPRGVPLSAADEILSQVDRDQLAKRVRADPAEVEQAARTALPALLGGLDATASDPAGAASLAEALGQHDGSLVDGGVALSQVDQAEGEKIAQH